MGIISEWYRKKEIMYHVNRFSYLTIEAGEDIPLNKWFQKADARNKSFINYKENWGPDWKYASPIPGESNVKVVGLSREIRAAEFLQLAQSDDFKLYLEDDPANPVNKNARKVMVSATFDGEFLIRHIGYLQDEIVNKYAGVELNVSPKSIFLPPSKKMNLGVKAALLQRSASYLKKKEKEK